MTCANQLALGRMRSDPAVVIQPSPPAVCRRIRECYDCMRCDPVVWCGDAGGGGGETPPPHCSCQSCFR
jgi:hypothetical protein